MNTAQHAGKILEAWSFADRSSLDDALDGASVSCSSVRSISRFEFEKQEMLQSIVEHLRNLESHGELPECSQGSGAMTLLCHLSSNLGHEEATVKSKLARKR